MKTYVSLILLSAMSLPYADACDGSGLVLKDKQGNIALIKESFDCWHKDNQPDRCYKINEIPKKQLHLQGFRSHHVIYQGKEYAFVESWRRGAPAYVTGAFEWDRKDVAKFIKVPTGFTPGPDEEMNFSFSSKLNPPFESLVEPPSELDGKNFVFARCK